MHTCGLPLELQTGRPHPHGDTTRGHTTPRSRQSRQPNAPPPHGARPLAPAPVCTHSNAMFDAAAQTHSRTTCALRWEQCSFPETDKAAVEWMSLVYT